MLAVVKQSQECAVEAPTDCAWHRPCKMHPIKWTRGSQVFRAAVAAARHCQGQFCAQLGSRLELPPRASSSLGHGWVLLELLAAPAPEQLPS